MLNELFRNLSSSGFVLKETISFLIIITALTYLFFDFGTTEYILFLVCISALSVIFLNFAGKKRNRELQQLTSTLIKIRNGQINSPDEINLSPSLFLFQEEIKKTYENLKNTIEYLRKLEKMRTEFVANVSHELKTPIFAIQGYLETLLDGAINDPKVNKSFLEKAVHHTKNLNNLLSDLIDISMIESGEMRISFRYFNLYDYLKEIVQEFLPEAKKKNIPFILHPLRENLLVFGDRAKLKQVFSNLINNALEYTDKGKVELIAEEENKWVKIIVRDTGSGISEVDKERIFERFYRVDKARSREVGGTGLGLSIVKHILEKHNSRIEVKSKIGEGTEFYFKLKK